MGLGVSNVVAYNQVDRLENIIIDNKEEIGLTREALEKSDDALKKSSQELIDIEESFGELEVENQTLLDDIELLSEEVGTLKEKNNNLQSENEKLSIREKAVTPNVSSKKSNKSGQSSNNNSDGWTSMTVNASAYTLVENGDKLGGTGITSTGAIPKANRTIAVDPRVIPYGSQIKYNGVVYTAEDTGGMIKGNKVDIFMNTLEETVNFGRRDIEILVKRP